MLPRIGVEIILPQFLLWINQSKDTVVSTQ